MKYFLGEEVYIDKEDDDEDDLHDERYQEGGQTDHDEVLVLPHQQTHFACTRIHGWGIKLELYY